MIDVTYTYPKVMPGFVPLVEKGCKLWKVGDKGSHIHLDIPYSALGIGLWGLVDRLIRNDKEEKLTKFTWSFNKLLRARRPLPRAVRVSSVKPNHTRKHVRDAQRAKRIAEGKRIHT